MKAMFTKGSHARSALRSRLIVVRLQADLPRVADATDWDDVAGADILEYLDVGTTDVWAHIGTRYFSLSHELLQEARRRGWQGPGDRLSGGVGSNVRFCSCMLP